MAATHHDHIKLLGIVHTNPFAWSGADLVARPLPLQQIIGLLWQTAKA
jgi:hypothetical protein